MTDVCPMSKILSVLSRKWTLMILRQLNNNGKTRFNELLGVTGNISPRTLSKRMKELEKNGLVVKKHFNEMPPRVEYHLSVSGKELIKCFKYLDDWVGKWG